MIYGRAPPASPSPPDGRDLPRRLTAHIGSAAVTCEVRPLGGAIVRLRLARRCRCISATCCCSATRPRPGRGAGARRGERARRAPARAAPPGRGTGSRGPAGGRPYRMRRSCWARTGCCARATCWPWGALPAARRRCAVTGTPIRSTGRELGGRLAEEVRRHAAEHPLEPGMPRGGGPPRARPARPAAGRGAGTAAARAGRRADHGGARGAARAGGPGGEAARGGAVRAALPGAGGRAAGRAGAGSPGAGGGRTGRGPAPRGRRDRAAARRGRRAAELLARLPQPFTVSQARRPSTPAAGSRCRCWNTLTATVSPSGWTRCTAAAEYHRPNSKECP